MNKKNFLALTAASIIFLFVLGCVTPPMETEAEETEKLLTLTETGTVRTITRTQGRLLTEEEIQEDPNMHSVESWENNCTEKIRQPFTMLKMFMEMSIASGDLNSEEKEKAEEALEAFALLEKMISCEFKADKEKQTAEFVQRFEFDEKTIEALKLVSETMDETEEEIEEKEMLEIIEKEDRYIIKIPADTATTTDLTEEETTIEEIKIEIQGEVLSISPENYEREEDYYVFPGDMDETITVEYVPALFSPETPTPTPAETTPTPTEPEETPTPTEPEETPTPTPTTTTEESEDGLPMEGEVIILAVVAIIALVLLLGLIIFIKSKKGKRKDFKGFEENEEEKEKPEKKQEDKQDRNRRNSVQAVEFDTVKSKKTEDEEKQSDDELIEQKESPVKKTVSKELSESDQKLVERAVASLQDKKSKYSKEQLMNVMQDMGYNEKVSKEIVKQLYND